MDSKRLLWVVFLMVMWYITSIAAGVYNKAFLLKHDLQMLLTLAQSFAGVVGGLIVLGALRRVQFFTSWQELRILILLGLVHAVGTVLTNISTAKSTASFTHTIKARKGCELFLCFLHGDLSSDKYRLRNRYSPW